MAKTAKEKTKEKAPVAKAGKKPATKETPTNGRGRQKSEGLRKPQVRILECLAKSKQPLSRNEISEKANCDLAWLNSWIGSNNEEVRKKNDQDLPSLITLGYVKAVVQPSAGSDSRTVTCYLITAAGKSALSKI